MHTPDRFIACSSCGCHARAAESVCPHCGAWLRTSDGTLKIAAAALLMGLSVACANGKDSGVQALYGVADTSQLDNDGDGYTRAEGDCNDDDKDVHPGATETPGDSVDSNCNGDDDS